MIRAAVYEGALERFAGEVEHMIDSRGPVSYTHLTLPTTSPV